MAKSHQIGLNVKVMASGALPEAVRDRHTKERHGVIMQVVQCQWLSVPTDAWKLSEMGQYRYHMRPFAFKEGDKTGCRIANNIAKVGRGLS
jgi:hypothetical protein